MFADDDPTKPGAKPYTLGQDVSALSIADLDETIVKLRDEIIKLEEVRMRKKASAAAADALFKRT